jgi:phage terminase large subunit-like protein
LGGHTPLVIALDAAKGGETNLPDCFAMVAVSRQGEIVQVRYCGIWTPNPVLDFEPIENELVRLCQQFSVIEVAYDPYQLHDMATRLKKRGIANFREFSQGKDRLMADKQLQDLIMSRRIAHDGNPLLRQHIDNANIKKGGPDGVRIVKRSPSLKVDAAVALSMAASRSLYYTI